MPQHKETRPYAAYPLTIWLSKGRWVVYKRILTGTTIDMATIPSVLCMLHICQKCLPCLIPAQLVDTVLTRGFLVTTLHKKNVSMGIPHRKNATHETKK